MLLMIAYGASIGGIGTKVGSPPNLITHRRSSRRRGVDASRFFTWMKVMVPMLALMFVVLFVLLYVLHPDERAATRRRRRRDRRGDEAAGLLDVPAPASATALGRVDARARSTR